MILNPPDKNEGIIETAAPSIIHVVILLYLYSVVFCLLSLVWLKTIC